jgi:hypothetical protein
MVEKTPTPAEDKVAKTVEIESLVRKHIKHATLTEDAFKYMS